MDFSIKKLGPPDLSLARELIKAWQRDDGVLKFVLPSDPYLEALLAKDSFHLWVALQNNRVAGGLTAYEIPIFDLEENEMFLFEIGVSKEFRQQGIAKALIENLQKTCREKGIKVIFVGTSLDNEAARQLYATTGGEVEIIPWFTYHLK